MDKLKLGMVGGGQGAFIGQVHRMAARLDHEWELVAGALSSDPSRAQSSGEELGLKKERIYHHFEQMAAAEAAREDGIDAVAIVTPNHFHAAPAICFLQAGIHVICDKPLAATLEDAEAIAAAVKDTGKLFILTHNYTAYPLIREARERISQGDLGNIRLVQVEYIQGWLAQEMSNKQADWRTDPAQSGLGGCIADIGTHAFNLASFVTGLNAEMLSADVDTFVPGRRVCDNAHVMLRYGGGAKGMLWSSQVAIGHENGLRLRVYGDKGSIDWEQENPNRMGFSLIGQPSQILTRGGAGSTDAGLQTTRIPPGHPEGYLEGFATIYSETARAIRHKDHGIPLGKGTFTPSIYDGLQGMRFIEACLSSSRSNSSWVALSEEN